MGKWTTEYSPARGRLIVIGGKYYPVCNILKVSELLDIHNSDIAALEEDNDIYRELHERLAADNVTLRARVAELENEHSDKLAAVMEYLRENAVAQCQCEHNRDGERVYHCDYCQDYENACRIAEGE